MTLKADAAKTARGTLGFVVQNSANSLLGLLLFAVFARFVTKSEMGVYAGFSFTITLFQTLGILGLNVAAPRFVAKLLAEGERGSASAVARTIIFLSLGAGGLLAMIHYLLASRFSFLLSGTPDYALHFTVASAVILVFVPMLVLEGLMQGVQEYGRLATLRVAAQVVRIIVSVWLLLNGWGLIGMIVGWTILGLLVGVCSVLFLGCHLDLGSGLYPPGSILRYSLPLLGAALVVFLSNNIDIFIVITEGSPTDLGAYNVAVTASGALTTILIASASATLLPAMSAHFGAGGLAGVERVFYRATRYLTLLCTPAALGLASLAWPAIWIMGGPAYRDSAPSLTIISISFLAYVLSTPIMISLQAVGETGRVLVVAVAATAVCSLFSAALFPILGIEGAALGRASLFASTLVIGLYESGKVVKLRFDLEALWKSFTASLLMASAVYITGSAGVSWVNIPAGVLLGAAIYTVTLRLLGAVKREDVDVLRRILPSRFKGLSETMESVLTRLLVQTGD
ncbi:polysaccharide biosynthesis protein [Candidatus Bathyarchaeota archaeon]|nr:polysaccharide biosynthesis protein [Candidatus Bathyarchaeota archaeon]